MSSTRRSSSASGTASTVQSERRTWAVSSRSSTDAAGQLRAQGRPIRQQIVPLAAETMHQFMDQGLHRGGEGAVLDGLDSAHGTLEAGSTHTNRFRFSTNKGIS